MIPQHQVEMTSRLYFSTDVADAVPVTKYKPTTKYTLGQFATYLVEQIDKGRKISKFIKMRCVADETTGDYTGHSSQTPFTIIWDQIETGGELTVNTSSGQKLLVIPNSMITVLDGGTSDYEFVISSAVELEPGRYGFGGISGQSEETYHYKMGSYNSLDNLNFIITSKTTLSYSVIITPSDFEVSFKNIAGRVIKPKIFKYDDSEWPYEYNPRDWEEVKGVQGYNSRKQYLKGNEAIYQYTLYKCKEDTPEKGEAFNSKHWDAVLQGSKLWLDHVGVLWMVDNGKLLSHKAMYLKTNACIPYKAHNEVIEKNGITVDIQFGGRSITINGTPFRDTTIKLHDVYLFPKHNYNFNILKGSKNTHYLKWGDYVSYEGRATGGEHGATHTLELIIKKQEKKVSGKEIYENFEVSPEMNDVASASTNCNGVVWHIFTVDMQGHETYFSFPNVYFFCTYNKQYGGKNTPYKIGAVNKLLNSDAMCNVIDSETVDSNYQDYGIFSNSLIHINNSTALVILPKERTNPYSVDEEWTVFAINKDIWDWTAVDHFVNEHYIVDEVSPANGGGFYYMKYENNKLIVSKTIYSVEIGQYETTRTKIFEASGLIGDDNAHFCECSDSAFYRYLTISAGVVMPIGLSMNEIHYFTDWEAKEVQFDNIGYNWEVTYDIYDAHYDGPEAGQMILVPNIVTDEGLYNEEYLKFANDVFHLCYDEREIHHEIPELDNGHYHFRCTPYFPLEPIQNGDDLVIKCVALCQVVDYAPVLLDVNKIRKQEDYFVNLLVTIHNKEVSVRKSDSFIFNKLWSFRHFDDYQFEEQRGCRSYRRVNSIMSKPFVYNGETYRYYGGHDLYVQRKSDDHFDYIETVGFDRRFELYKTSDGEHYTRVKDFGNDFSIETNNRYFPKNFGDLGAYAKVNSLVFKGTKIHDISDYPITSNLEYRGYKYEYEDKDSTVAEVSVFDGFLSEVEYSEGTFERFNLVGERLLRSTNFLTLLNAVPTINISDFMLVCKLQWSDDLEATDFTHTNEHYIYAHFDGPELNNLLGFYISE